MCSQGRRADSPGGVGCVQLWVKAGGPRVGSGMAPAGTGLQQVHTHLRRASACSLPFMAASCCCIFQSA